MCGIAGGVALDRVSRPDPRRVARMSEILANRGPDGAGLWVSPSGRAVLAHRRLAIIDRETGAQPMLAMQGDAAITFNGEIYNFLELRPALEQGGWRFHTRSDTEVLVAGLVMHGDDWVRRLRGMFAFAFWDDKVGRLLLARDPMGKKPLYFSEEGGCLYFASSLSALRGTAAASWRASPAALRAYLRLGYVPAPLTACEEAHKLEAGTMAVVQAGSALESRRFWDPAAEAPPFEGSFEDAVDHTHELLADAVRVRLRSDVPVGMFLSGGVDSSLVAAVARHDCGIPLESFAIGFAEGAVDETHAASLVARRLGTHHHSFHRSTDLVELLPSLVEQFGEPVADPATLPLAELARATREHVTVALTGDGGDETFGGYPWYRTALRLRHMTKLAGGRALHVAREAVASTAIRALPGSAPVRRAARIVETMGRGDAAEQYAALRALDADGGHARGVEEELARTAATHRRAGGDLLRRMRCADLATYLPDCLMPKADVATMAHALEARAPLLDQELAAFALTLPTEYLLDASGGKRVLRALLRRYLPDSLVDQPKRGFPVPVAEWFRDPAFPPARTLASSEALGSLGVLPTRLVQRLLDEHRSGARDHGERLYALLVLETWARLA